ncbi:MAG: HEAT repeat domain-containing protein [Deltaproteobacteria bacterium]|nr:HEAT repeat domain-containing protein [Deltaproteobacteria bacterium]
MSRAVAVALLLGAATAHAHVVIQQPGLRQLMQAGTTTAIVEITSPLRLWSAPDGSDRQEYFTVRTVETVVGEAPPARFDVFPHGEGLPAWQPGDVALLFLEATASRPEMAGLATRFPYYTIQQAGQEWKLTGADGDAIRGAVLAYRALAAKPAAEGAPGLRELLLRSLRSGAQSLREDAIAELVRAKDAPGAFAGLFPGRADLTPFTALVAPDAGLPVTTRVALARILDGLHGFDADAAIRALTTEPLSAGERAQLVRVAGASQDPGISVWLASLLVEPDAALRREAAYALGHPWHAAHAQALATRLADPDSTVARAALRSLGAQESPEASAILRRVAGGDPGFLRQLAEAELRRATAGQQAPQAP